MFIRLVVVIKAVGSLSRILNLIYQKFDISIIRRIKKYYKIHAHTHSNKIKRQFFNF